MANLCLCTVATRRQLANVRVLARTLREQAPHERLQVLLLDDPFDIGQLDPGEFDRVHAIDIGITEEEFHVEAAHLSADELALWLRPKLMLTLLDSASNEKVLYLSPDSVVLGPLDVVGELFEEHAVLRVPLAAASAPAASARRHAESPGALRVWVPGFLGANGEGREWLERGARTHPRRRAPTSHRRRRPRC